MEKYLYYSLSHLVQTDYNRLLVRELLTEPCVNPNFQIPYDETLLVKAARSPEDNVGIVQELIAAGAEVSRGGNRSSYTPLHIAVIYRKRRVLEALLQSGASINAKDSFENTALHYAINNDFPRSKYFRDVPLHAQVPDLWIVRKLLDHEDINVNKRDIRLQTPIMLAIRDQHLEIVKLLLNRDSRLDIFNKYGQTPLHLALNHNDPCPFIVVLLLLKRATLLKMDLNDKTPLDIIIKLKPLDFACLYLKVIAFNYNIKGLLTNKLISNPKLSQFLKRCYQELNLMKLDIIANEWTIFDFFGKCVPISTFHNPILQIYKPVIDRIIVGIYTEYYCYILHRISKSNLAAVLTVVVIESYCTKNYDKGCEKYPTGFSEVVKLCLLNDYLSRFDIFRLIIAASRVKIDESLLKICHHECYLTDSWEEYPEEHLY